MTEAARGRCDGGHRTDVFRWVPLRVPEHARASGIDGRMKGKRSEMLLCGVVAAVLCALGPPALALPDPGWTVFSDDKNTTVDYPRGVFSVEGREDVPPGPVFTTRDHRARLHIFAFRNERGESPAQHIARTFTHDRRQLDYDRVARNFFALSENKGSEILYRRCNFARGMIHCIELVYPRSEKRAWDNIVTRISLSLRPR
jgi:hypothetical protein